ncbi:uncharacterized protein LOC124788949 [Schistocerca piceifrons]|uniref:uncharacterized protein LOC124788949 n=1 Tax=Schistocerca piceifrons TaxID=274613 RepID=UPI001F5E3BD9|nr:uncharacterized protein LOC124788949 [Schistocerca piceifrons]
MCSIEELLVSDWEEFNSHDACKNAAEGCAHSLLLAEWKRVILDECLKKNRNIVQQIMAMQQNGVKCILTAGQRAARRTPHAHRQCFRARARARGFASAPSCLCVECATPMPSDSTAGRSGAAPVTATVTVTTKTSTTHAVAAKRTRSAATFMSTAKTTRAETKSDWSLQMGVPAALHFIETRSRLFVGCRLSAQRR